MQRILLLAVMTVALALSSVGTALAYDDYAGTFLDDDGNVHEAQTEAIAEADVTRGCNPPENTEYCPDEGVTRGEMAAFLRRALDLPDAEGDDVDAFTDDDDSVFEDDIDAIAVLGITRGCNPPENTEFCPDDTISREQMAAFLERAFEYEPDDTDYFVDDDDSIFEAEIQAVKNAGVTVGCNPPENDRYCPTEDVQRDQMASFLARALDLEADDPTPFENQTTCDPAYSPCVPTVEEYGDLDCVDVVVEYPEGVLNDLEEFGDPHGLNSDDDTEGCEVGDPGDEDTLLDS